ncbi:TniQ family protein [Methylobacterium radiotolerans]|uniref:TniQ family protein n=1 Tax=Methylobacterium radiotolerans TaxID=31998 RepID=UPI001F293FF8|nr:TniQ family protein [Methylobacterium radiotolerans]UIY45319.1 TniQ family protein [Methylobacterium radiotolerans]
MAAHNGAETAREFCLDMGFTFQACVDGRPDALVKLSALTGTPIQTLKRACIKPVGTEYDVSSQRFSHAMLRRMNVHVCPICVDQDQVGQARVDIAPYGRLEWLLTVFRACPYHHCAIVNLVQSRRMQTHDFARHMGEMNAGGVCVEERIIPRHPSNLEAYVRARLANRPTGADWLDGLAMHVVITTCEMLGIVMTLGADVKSRALTEGMLHDGGHAGFEIARHGQQAVLDVMADLNRQHHANKTVRRGPATVFGLFYRTMLAGRRSDAFEPVREIIREHVITTTPVGPGDHILGKPVQRRVWHSIVTAARESNRHPMRLRKGLGSAGLLEPGHENLSNHFVLLDAERISPFLETYARGLSANKAFIYINCNRQQFDALADHGVIQPFVAHRGGRSDKRPTYSTRDLDFFIKQLRSGAVPIVKTDLRRKTISAAAKRLRCSSVEIVKLILDKKLCWKGYLPDVPGYFGTLVDVDELHALRNATTCDGLLIKEVAKILKTKEIVIRRLIREGYLTPRTVRDHRVWMPYLVIDYDNIEYFNRTYISFHALRQQFGTNNVSVANIMVDVEPAITRSQVGATFYRRDAIQTL